MPAEREEETRYLIGSRERRGLLAGWRPGQVGSVAAGLVIGVGFLRALPGAAGLLPALVSTLGGIAGACWPVGGRTLDEWVPTAVRHVALLLTGGRRWRDPAPAAGHVAGGRSVTARRRHAASRASVARAGCFGPLTIEAFDAGGAQLGVLHDRERGAWTAVVAVTGGSFALLGPDERGERVAAWSRLLAAIGRQGSSVHRLQWIERCIPDEGTALRAHFERSGGTAGATFTEDSVAAARHSYGRLLDLAGRDTVRHEHYVSVTVRGPRTAGLGPRRQPDRATLDQLASETAALERALRQAGVGVRAALGPEALGAMLAAAFERDPTSQAGDRRPARRSPWPEAYDVGWDHLRAGATLHASYWVAEWPRTEISDDFLVPLLTSGAARRTVAVVLGPVPSLRASRHAEQARTAGVADAEVRRRHGFAVTARARQEHDAVVRREAELASGHASYRFSGYLTVTAHDLDGLARACDAVERIAAGCQLDLRRLYGAQDAGFLATLPVGRGLS